MMYDHNLRRAIIGGSIAVLAALQTARAQEFDREIAPLIAARCLSCHSGDKPKGELDLSSKSTAMAGGESGLVIVPGKVDDSLLWEHIESDEMPPKKPLPEAEKALLKKWIAAGAKWGTETIDPFRYTTELRAGYDWWSLQPAAKPVLPKDLQPPWARNPIDAFIGARLEAAGLAPSKEADKRTLIRRLSFDLLGLPPSPEDVKSFLDDDSPDAYEKLVDRMLASPHYGERWARHWLDVVRFGESNGFEYDQPRNNAWHYRNWVIDALNADMPYDEFVRMQLAGDALRPNDPDVYAATGFLVAGPHNTTLPVSQKMRMTMAQDELEDLVGVVGQTFLGLTINCARCHDHKFDPISQKEYYQLVATLSGVKHGERTVQTTTSPEQKTRIDEIGTQLAAIEKERQAVQQAARDKVLAARKDGKAAKPEPPKPYAAWEFDGDLKDSQGRLDAQAIGGARVENGMLVLDGKGAYAATKPLSIAIQEKTLEAWVQLDDMNQRGGGAISLQTPDGLTFDAIVFGEKTPKQWMAGSDFYRRWRSFGGQPETQASQPAHVAIVYTKDGTITGYRNGKPYGKPYRHAALQPFAAGAQVVFGVRHTPAGRGRMLKGRIARARFYDRALSAEQVAASAGVADSNYVAESQILAQLTPKQRVRQDELKRQRSQLEAERSKLTNTQPQKVYTNVSGNPGVVRFLRRGSVADPGEIVSPAGLQSVPGGDPDFGVANKARDADRRKALAKWITHRDNPLFARVIVNRLWHHHFGQGLIKTPNDFGYNGGQPSHPQLLSWLACALWKHEFRLKPIHRLIVTSATYRQSSASNAAAEKVDADNRLVWRRTPQRLEAEAIRDAMLFASGQLDPQLGGKGYRDVRHFSHKGSNFYEPIQESSERPLRRTIYRFTPRGGRNPFLDTFDCPDPSTTTPQRASTTTPLQALALMNNAFAFKMAERFAEKVESEAKDDISAQVDRVIQLAYGRPADEAEKKRASEFVAQHGLKAFCRVVFNSNEFVYVQ